MELDRLRQFVITRVRVRRDRAPRSFSLVELLVATSIIVILLSLMLPAMKRSIRQARATVCMHNLRSLDQLLHLYRNDNQRWLPLVEIPEDAPLSGEPSAWYDLLVPEYVSDLSFLVCPEDPVGSLLHVANPATPVADWQRSASYGLNGFMFASPGGLLANDRHQPRRPQDTLLAADMGPDASWHGNNYVPSGSSSKPRQARLSWADDFDYGTPHPRYSWLTRRHSDSINVLTLGGAVRRIRTTKTMAQTVQEYYDECAAGDCVFCRQLQVAHYSFAHARTYWWTGPVPPP